MVLAFAGDSTITKFICLSVMLRIPLLVSATPTNPAGRFYPAATTAQADSADAHFSAAKIEKKNEGYTLYKASSPIGA